MTSIINFAKYDIYATIEDVSKAPTKSLLQIFLPSTPSSTPVGGPAPLTNPRGDDLKYTLYCIKVDIREKSNQKIIKSWLVNRRYASFHKLHQSLLKYSFVGPSLPPKRLWRNRESEFIERRRIALELWLRATLSIVCSQMDLLNEKAIMRYFRKFLEIGVIEFPPSSLVEEYNRELQQVYLSNQIRIAVTNAEEKLDADGGGLAVRDDNLTRRSSFDEGMAEIYNKLTKAKINQQREFVEDDESVTPVSVPVTPTSNALHSAMFTMYTNNVLRSVCEVLSEKSKDGPFSPIDDWSLSGDEESSDAASVFSTSMSSIGSYIVSNNSNNNNNNFIPRRSFSENNLVSFGGGEGEDMISLVKGKSYVEHSTSNHLSSSLRDESGSSSVSNPSFKRIRLSNSYKNLSYNDLLHSKSLTSLSQLAGEGLGDILTMSFPSNENAFHVPNDRSSDPIDVEKDLDIKMSHSCALALESLLSIVKETLNLKIESEWKIKEVMKDVVSFKKASSLKDGGVERQVFRGQVCANAAYIYLQLKSLDFWKNIFPFIQEVTLLKEIDKYESMFYISCMYPLAVTGIGKEVGVDYCVCVCNCQDSSGAYICSMRSVSSYMAPVSLSHTRGWKETSGFVILPTSDDECSEVAFVTQEAVLGLDSQRDAMEAVVNSCKKVILTLRDFIVADRMIYLHKQRSLSELGI